MSDIDKFDPDFFGVSPREAKLMDPQQRMFMESVWRVIEDAGYKASALSGSRTGLFVGVMSGDYAELMQENNAGFEAHSFTGSMNFILPNRISYILNFRGPSEVIDTACSSSLVAIQRAIASMRSGECDSAIAGGVNALLHPRSFIAYSQAGMLSPSGSCKTFGKGADGYVRGEGAGAVFLKPLSKAEADGDRIYGLIIGAAVNHGGRANSLTAPNPEAQAELLVSAYEQAGVSPAVVGYIEAHGTGTELGDPVEINGLKKAFEELYKKRGLDPPAEPGCGLGSVKTNIGHLESAAGAAGLIKVLLSLRHKKLPAMVGFKELNPYISLANSPFYIVDKTRDWEAFKDDAGEEIPRIAGVSSFGAGGANAHIVVEEYRPDRENETPEARIPAPYLIVLSARSKERLKVYAEKMIAFLENNSQKSVSRDLKSLVAENLLDWLSRELQVAADEIDAGLRFEDQGIETISLQALLEVLNNRYGTDVAPAVFVDYPNIDSLAAYLADSQRDKLLSRHREEMKREKSVESKEDEEKFLSGLSYALLTARETMEERLALVASAKKEVLDSLKDYLKTGRESGSLFLGSADDDDSNKEPTAEEKEGKELLKTIIEEKNTDKLARLWVGGMEIDWSDLHGEKKPRRISPPAYPFSKERHWINLRGEQAAPPAIKTELEKPGKISLKAAEKAAAPALGETAIPAGKISLKKDGAGLPAKVPKPETPAETAGSEPQTNRFLISDVKEIIKKELSAVALLEVSKIPEKKPFAEMGLDSVLGVELTNRLRSLFDVDLPAAKLYDYPSIQTLSEYISTVAKPENLKPGSDALTGKKKKSVFKRELSFGTPVSKSGVKSETAIPPAKTSLKDDKTAFPAKDREKKPGSESQTDRFLISDVKEIIKKELSAVALLEVSKISEKKPFAEMGLDSVLGVELTNRLRSLFDVDLPAAKLYDYPSIQTLSEYISTVAKPENLKPGSDALTGKKKKNVFKRELSFGTPSPKSDVKEARDRIATVPPSFQKRSVFSPDREKIAPDRVKAARDIAVIGMSARFPDARDIEEFWENLASGRDSIREIPPERWDWRSSYDPDPKAPEKNYCKWGGFLDDIDRFDPLFFSVSPTEAELMDPQHRLFLEESWKALENAGYSPSRLNELVCGVYAGALNNDYQTLLTKGDSFINPSLEMLGNLNSLLPARIAYFLNLKGPTLMLDTACSSSLTAVHLACLSLLKGEADLMLAGGVTLYISEDTYIKMCAAGMLSPEGKCKTFDDGADGFVPGEGVGVLVLKTLDKALEHGDRIYGVIKGSGINQDGKTNGITAPSAESQKALELETLRKSGVNPETISYVETHGTGTSLGDPIEIGALSSAFGKHTDKKQYCAVGSVKTNIGHTSAAAGAAGVIKILLGMKHGKIPPSLNFKKSNRHINFENTPFYVNTELKDWEREEGRLRRAAVSSFGFSGTNAHLILEEYPVSETMDEAKTKPPYLAVLSARTRERLKAVVRRMVEFLEKRSGSDLSMSEIAYLLQTEREAMEERLAMLTDDAEDFLAKLKDYLEGREEAPFLYSGSVDRENAQNELLVGGEAGELFIKTIIKNRELGRLGRLWVGGVDIDWKSLRGKPKSKKISLPAYPFAREYCWIPERKTGSSAGRSRKQTRHFSGRPDVEFSLENKGVAFRSVLTPETRVARHHKVKGRPLFPGAAFIEAAYAALEETTDSDGFDLCGVVFANPLWADKEKEYLITLLKEEEKIRCEIRSPESENLIYCKGEFIPEKEREVSSRERFSLEELKSGFENSVQGDQFYSELKEAGLDYGPSFQTVQQAWFKEGEALGMLELDRKSPRPLQSRAPAPGMLDGALQLSTLAIGGPARLKVFFALRRLEIFSSLKQRVWCYVKKAGKDEFNAAVFSREGELIFKAYGFRAVTPKKGFVEPGGEPGTGGEPKIETGGTAADFLYLPQWKKAPDLKDGERFDPSGKPALIVGGGDSRLAESLAALHAPGRVVRADADLLSASPEKLKDAKEIGPVYFLAGLESGKPAEKRWPDIAEKTEETALFLFRLMKFLDKSGFLKKGLKLKIVSADLFQTGDEEIIPNAAALLGLARSLANEYEKLEVAFLDLSLSDLESGASETGRSPAEAIAAEPFKRKLAEISLKNGIRSRRVLLPVSMPDEARSVFREKGIYLILGGAGGVGLELARYLAETRKAGLILIGRSELDAETENKLSRLRASGSKAVYLRADAADFESLKKAVEEGRRLVGEINGAVHSALVLEDALFARMSEESFKSALAPKVAGSVNLARVLAGTPLDFMVFFSSLQSFWGNSGQSNYTAASAFQDAWASCLDRRLPFPVKIVNWGYWGTVGIVADDRYRKLMKELGVYSISPAEGMRAVENILNGEASQAAAVKADEKFLKGLGFDFDEKLKLLPARVPSLAGQLAAEIKLPAESADLLDFKRGFEELEALIPTALLKVFRDNGAFRVPGARRGVGELRDSLGVVSKYRPLYQAMIEMLERSGMIELEYSGGDDVSALLKPGAEKLADIDKEKERLKKLFPSLKPHLRLLSVCLDSCFPMLRGETGYAGVLFPRGSLELTAAVYRDNPSADYYNLLCSEFIGLYLEKRFQADPDQKLRILEVGAGSGGTSLEIFKRIDSFRDRISYCYTDVSPRFTQYAAERFKPAYPFVEPMIFNLEKETESQGIDPESVDLVLGVNVLHAVSVLEKSLGGLKKILKRNGILLLSEATRRSDFLTLTFGFADGWWLFEDSEYRVRHSPLLGAEEWRRRLSLAGFRGAGVLKTTLDHGFDQTLIFSESDGLILKSFPTEKKSSFEKPGPAAIQTRGAEKPSASPKPAGGPLSDSKLEEKTLAHLRSVFSNALRIPEHRIKDRETFENYGVDSLMIMELNKRLEKDFGPLSATLLFENPALKSLASYFISEKRSELERLFPASESASMESLFDDYVPEKRVPEDAAPVFEKEPRIAPLIRETAPARVAAIQTDIAIVGVSGRYPMAGDLNEFWRNLKEGRDCVSEVPSERWNWRDHIPPDKDSKGYSYAKWGGFIDGVDQFDSRFFNITPREARSMDPQERLFLETVWEALEDGGHGKKALEGSETGVFAGVMNSDYHWTSGLAWSLNRDVGAGSDHWSLANRVSYFFDWKGPSMTVNTACSSSLTAVHLAAESLRRGECSMAAAGGINLILHPLHFIRLCGVNMPSSSAKNRSFGAGADGFVPGEGTGVVLLKPLDRAVKDNDRIYGIIKASRVNSDGKTGGYTVPNPVAQGALIKNALKVAGIKPESLGYIEAHGTGTSLGDPIEINGLKRAFEQDVDEKQYCAVGSVKSNIGHLESAAGIAGLTKILLQIKSRLLVPSLHSRELNPLIDFEDSPFYVQRELSDWLPRPAGGAESGKFYPLRAGISSFGAGGANAHLIIEEYQPDPEKNIPEIKTSPPFLIVLSARNEERLEVYAQKMLDFLKDRSREESAGVLKKSLNSEKLKKLLEDDLLESLSKIMSVPAEELDRELSFADQGIERIQLQDWAEVLSCKYDLEFQPSLFVEYPSVASLSAWPPDKRRKKLFSYYGGEEEKKTIVPEEDELSLSDLAYTLQVGREAMEERLAMTVHSREELLSKLEKYLKHGRESGVARLGNAGKDGAKAEALAGKAGKEFVKTLLAEREIDKLAELWVGGAEIDWNSLCGENKPRRISLPTYPFAKDSHRLNIAQDKISSEKTPTGLSESKKTIPTPSETPAFEEIQIPAGKVVLKDQGKTPGRTTSPAVSEKPQKPRRKTPRAEALLKSEIKEAIKKELSVVSLLKSSEIDENQSFMDMGLDSVLGVELVKRLNKALNIRFAAARLYDYPSVDGLAGYLSKITTGERPGSAEPGETGRAKKEISGFKDVRISLKTTALTKKSDAKILTASGPERSAVSSSPDIEEIKEEIKEKIKEELSAVSLLELSEIDENQSFTDMGLDSVLGVELANRLNKTLNIRFTAARLYDYPSVVSLAGYLSRIAAGGRSRSSETGKTKEKTSDLKESESSPKTVLRESGAKILTASGPERSAVSSSPDIEEIKEKIKEELSAVSLLELSEIDENQSFTDMGLDSVLGVELVKRLNKALNIRFTAARLYDYSSVLGLAGYLSKITSGERSKSAEIGKTREPEVRRSGWLSEEDYPTIRGAKPASSTASEKSSKTSAPLVRRAKSSPDGGSIKPRAGTETKIREASGFKPVSYYEKRRTPDVEEDKIAVIGMSARFPDARNTEEFWENLASGRDSIREIPPERWDWRRFYDPDPKIPKKSSCKWGGFLDDIDKFDPQFFNISPAEAELMDPQQRLFLMESWKALEDAGYSRSSLSDMKCGVYAGVMSNDYNRLLIPKKMAFSPSAEMTGNSNSILAARIAYFLNLKGATLALDTACSSSLVAIYLACQILLRKEADMMLAGGVTLYLVEESYIMMSKAGMLSPKGKCSSFDAAADGFVPGEGVGIVVLKTLSKALEDGDRIYGVIRGIGVNQDGKTNGITAPSSESQKALELEVYRKNGINPETISYVETHGTGTPLGDPIEIDALSDSFGEYTDKKQYCALGSVKTNIGHASAAAGVGSVIKALLCMKHNAIPPNLNFKKSNRDINFENTPFYVNTELKDWRGKRNVPRRAAVSSFAFCGTNAHLVLEDPPVSETVSETSIPAPYLLVLSAKNKERLESYVRKMIRFLEKVLKRKGDEKTETEESKVFLSDLTHTMRTRREAMEERLAVLAKNTAELSAALKNYLKTGEAPGLYSRNIKKGKDELVGYLMRGKEARDFVQKLTRGREMNKLARLWTSGVEIDWNLLYKDAKPKMIFAPSYPFAEERCWFPEERRAPEFFPAETVRDKRPPSPRDMFHPLLGGQSPAAERDKKITFESLIELKSSPFLSDHRVSGDAVMPAAAFLEMALAAARVCLNSDQIDLNDITFSQPLILSEDEPNPVHVELDVPKDAGRRDFRIVGPTKSGEGEKPAREYISGEISLRKTTGAPEKTDLKKLRSRCADETPAEDFYREMRERRIEYGPSFRGAREILRGDSEVLGLLELPEEALADADDYNIHPALLDSALQLGAALLPGGGKETYLPVEIEKLRFYQSPETVMRCFASADRSDDPNWSALRFKKLSLFTETGDTAAVLEGFVVKKADLTAVMDDQYLDDWLWQMDWIPKEKKSSESAAAFEPERRVIFADEQGIGREMAELLRTRGSFCALVFAGEKYERINKDEFKVNPENPDDFVALFEEFKRDFHKTGPDKPEAISVIYLWSSGEAAAPENLTTTSKSACLSFLYLIQSALKANFSRPPSIWLVTRNSQVVASESAGAEKLSVDQAPLWAMGRTITTERPELTLGMIDLDYDDDIAADLLDEVEDPDSEKHVAFRNGRRYTARLRKLGKSAAKTTALKENASYLITGGLTGLGLKIAGWMADQGAGHLILISRRGLSEDDETAALAIDKIRGKGVKVAALKVDVSDRAAMAETMDMIKSSMPPLKGIVHSAGLTSDALLEDQSGEKFAEVAAAKIDGSWNLHVLTEDLSLEFFVCFSSIASMLGSPGQINYSAANAFMDALAFRRRSLGLPATSVNWGAWTEIGMAANLDETRRERAARVMKTITPYRGLRIMEKILSASDAQIGAVSIDWGVYLEQFPPDKIPSLFARQASARTKTRKESDILSRLNDASDEKRRDILIEYLQAETVRALRLKSSPDPTNNFLEMGMDSLMAMEFKNQLEIGLKCPLSANVALEFPTIADLAEYLLQKVSESGESEDLENEDTADMEEIEI